MGPNLNIMPPQEEEMAIDLNQPAGQNVEGPLEVIINPAHPVEADFLQINDLIDNPVEAVPLQAHID